MNTLFHLKRVAMPGHAQIRFQTSIDANSIESVSFWFLGEKKQALVQGKSGLEYSVEDEVSIRLLEEKWTPSELD